MSFDFPPRIVLVGHDPKKLKYGENPPQEGRLYDGNTGHPLALSKFHHLNEDTAPAGYVNVADMDRALRALVAVAAALEINEGSAQAPIAIAVKHGNACGASVGEHPADALERMLLGDPIAVHGAFIVTNFEIEGDLAETLLHYNMPGTQSRLIDGIAAPDFSQRAVNALYRKTGKCPLFSNSALENTGLPHLEKETIIYRSTIGGDLLVQTSPQYVPKFSDMQCFGEAPVLRHRDLSLAWGIGSRSTSNTITLTKNSMLIGNGVGQQDRVGAARLAIRRARGWKRPKQATHEVKGAVAYSDSFFPFPDGAQVLLRAGVRVIMATGGAKFEKKVIATCQKAGATLLLPSDKEARGFWNH